jgi:hypothetical protein
LEIPHDTRVGLQVPYLVRIHVIYGEKLWIIIFIFLLSIIFKNAKSMHWTIRVFFGEDFDKIKCPSCMQLLNILMQVWEFLIKNS